MTAVDKHSPHHIRRRDSLNILHQRQLDFLTSAKAQNEQTVETLMCLEAKKIAFLIKFTADLLLT